MKKVSHYKNSPLENILCHDKKKRLLRMDQILNFKSCSTILKAKYLKSAQNMNAG